MDDAVESEDARLNGVRPSRIPVDRALQMRGADGKPLVLFENVFPATPSGKIELKSEALATRWGAAALLPDWQERNAGLPLRLISPASDKRISSTLGGLPGSRRAPALLMHPEDAARRQLASGSEGKGGDERGEGILPLKLANARPPGGVARGKGAWLPARRPGPP